MNNWVIVECRQSREKLVAAEINLLGCGSYIALSLGFKAISRNAPGKRRIETPIIPRLVFASASYPDRDLICSIYGVDRIIRNDHGQALVIPGWQMAPFIEKVAQERLEAERRALPPPRPKGRKWVKLGDHNAMDVLMSYFDHETGEIFDIEKAA